MRQLLILLFIGIFINNNLNAQEYEENFLGEDFLLYKGKLLKLKNMSSNISYKFYSDIQHCQKNYDDNVVYPDIKYKFDTVKDSLEEKIFKVENIINKEGIAITQSSYFDNPIFILRDTLTNKIIYFKYDTKYNFEFPFITSKINIDETSFCEKVTKEVDDFTGDIQIRSPLSSNLEIASMSLSKTIRKSKTYYYLRLRTHSSTVVVDGEGVTILFTDGTKWTKPTKIDVEADKKDFEYSAFISLTQSDLNVLSFKKIKKFRLYIFDENVKSFDADKFRVYMKCIIKSK